MNQKFGRKLLVVLFIFFMMFQNALQVAAVVSTIDVEEQSSEEISPQEEQSSEEISPQEEQSTEKISPQEEQSTEKSELAIQENSDLNEEVKDHSSSVIEERLNKAETNGLLSEEISLSNVIVDNNEYQFFGTDGNSTAVLVRHTGFLVGNVQIPMEVLNTAANWQQPSPVVEIGDEAFSSVGLVNVTLPSSLKVIGKEAFYGNQLTSVIIPNGVTSIGMGAFRYNRLTSVSIPDTVTNVSNYAFFQNNLSNIKLSASMTSIGDYVFGSNRLTSFEIPSNIISLGDAVFVNNELSSITIPNSVISMGNAVFRNNYLTNIDIPNSMASIGNSAFQNNRLASVRIPDSVTSIGNSTFQDNNLLSIIIPDSMASIGNSAFQNNRLVSVRIPDSVTSIGNSTFQDNNLLSIIIPDNLTNIGSSAFASNPLKFLETSVENIESLRNMLSVDVMKSVTEKTILRTLNYKKDTEKNKSVISGESVTWEIAQQYQLRSTTDPTWEKYSPSVQWIKDGNDLFGEVNPLLKLESVTPSDSGVYHAVVDTIRYSDINLEVEAESEFVFEYNGTDGDSTATLVGYNGDGGAVVIPSEAVNSEKGWEGSSAVTAIGADVFRNKRLTSVVIPNSVTSIGVSAFRENNLTSVDIPNNVTSIEAYAFYLNNLESVTIPNNVTSIEPAVFAYNNLTSVFIPNSVTSIEREAFLNNNLTSVAIPNSVTNIGILVFVGNPLKFIETSVENVETLCSMLPIETMLSVSERTILRALDYEIGTENEQVVSVGQTIDFAISQQYQLRSTANPVWEEYTPTVQWVKNRENLSGQTGPILTLDSITTSDSGVYYAVVDTIRYTDLTLEVEVEVAEFVFEFSGIDGNSTATLVGYNGIGGNVIIPSEVVNAELGWEIPSSVVEISSYVFKDKNLINVQIPDSIINIGRNAFANNKLTEVKIPSSVTSLGSNIFWGNPLKFVETNVENVDILRTLLNSATSLSGVTERTILLAFDYEVGTQRDRTVLVGSTIDYTISQQYRMRAISNSTLDAYTPAVQWEKDNVPLEEDTSKVLHLGNVQESDSGVYRAVVDGIIFSDLQLQVDPELEPDIPSIDPNEPSVLPENVNPSVEGLSIRYISNIRFNSAPFSLLDQTLRLENEPMITIQDMRPRAERSGWELLVSMDSTFMNGAEIVMHPFIHQENQTNLLIEGASELILNDEPQRFAGTTMIEEPNPFGILSMGMGSVENPMTLRVPGKTGVNSYETTVHWQLVTGP
ncbi:leucine-rich repeat protein [Enterococcus casseliflavus]|nr:leucine-rich repeat protein [Enterococcus casseliflavus]